MGVTDTWDCSDELERTTGHERHPISSGDLNSDCLQRLITVHTIVSLHCPSLVSVLATTQDLGLPYVLSPLFLPLLVCSFCVAVVEMKTQ